MAYAAVFAYFIPIFILADKDHEIWAAVQVVYAIVGVVFVLAMGLAHVFTIVKRFHDRDKAWPWIFVAFIPYVGSLWILIECGCLAGKPGRNRFGADPHNPEEDIVDVFGPARTPLPQVGQEPRLAPDVSIRLEDRLR